MAKHSARVPWRARVAVTTAVILGAATTVALLTTSAQALTTATLPGGTSISVDVAQPTDGATVAPGTQVTVSGTASIGAAATTANTTLVTGIDSSGSTADSSGSTACGNPNGDGSTNDVLDCEITAAVNLNSAAVTAGSIVNVGAVSFAANAATADVDPAAGQQLLTGPADDKNTNAQRDIVEVFDSVVRGSVGKFTSHTTGTTTNFTDAITKANTVLAGSTQPNKYFVLLSDGVANGGGSTLAAINARPAGTVIDTFAVGSGSSCGSANDANQQSLAYIASHAGGTCTAVTNPGSLPSILPSLITPHLTALALSDNGGAPTTITTPALPVSGPGGTAYSITTPPLAPGTHRLCVTATGTDPGTGTVQECKTITAGNFQVTVVAQNYDKLFGDANPAFMFTVVGLQTGDSLTTAPTCISSATTTSDIGDYAITCSGAAADPNKYDIHYVDGNLHIAPAGSTVSGPHPHKAFGDADPSFAPTADNGAPVPAGAVCTAPTPHEAVGTYPLTCTGPAAQGNYVYVYADGLLTVDPVASVVTGPSVHKMFGDPDPSFAPTASNAAPVPATALCTAPATHTNIGTYVLHCTGPAAEGNYTYTYVSGSLTIDPAASVVSGPNPHKVFGAADPSFAPSASNGAPVPGGASCTAPDPHANVGTYALTCTGPAAQGNFTYTYSDGSLTVDPAGSVVSGPHPHEMFGDADPSFAPTADGGAPVPDGALCTAPDPHANVGTYTLTCTGPAAQGNFTYTYADGQLTVDAAKSVVSGPNVHKIYGDADPSFAPTASNGAPVPADAACTAPASHANVGTYTLTCTGSASAGNYTYTYANGSLRVDPAPVVVTAQDAVKTYGDPDPAYTPQVDGLQNGDSLPANVRCAATNPHTNVGTYDITCTGPATSGNYTFGYVGPATLTVQKATPLVSTTPSGTTPLGGFAADTATLTHTLVASGTVTFTLYGPGDTACSTPLTVLTKGVAGDVSHSGNAQVVAGPGVYRWTATYNGDANNTASLSGCSDETFTVLAQRLTGEAYGITAQASLLSLPLLNIVPTPSTGAVSTTASTAVEPACLANIALLVGVQADCAAVATFNGYPATSNAVASLAAVQVPIATLPLINVGAVQAFSHTTCAGSTGSTTIAYLAVGTVVLISRPTVIKPNTTLNVGVVKLVLNEQTAFSTPDKGLTVNAIHITVNVLGLAKANVVISSAESDISGCR